MPEDKQSGPSELLDKSASAAKTIEGAVKTGKAIAGIAKGAAGGPYGMAAMALWQNRKLVGKIIAAATFIMILPILFILMLPSLIFGGLNADTSSLPIMNDNAAIYTNIDDAKARIYAVLNDAHTAKLGEIQAQIDALSEDDEHETVDTFNVDSAVDVNTLISQYCAYKDDYSQISTDDLISIIEAHKDNLFSFTETTSPKQVTTKQNVDVTSTVTEYVDSTVTDSDGTTHTVKVPVQKQVTTTEQQDVTTTVTMHTYTLSFAGSDYFANTVFHLDASQATTASDYAENLALFLANQNVPNQSGGASSADAPQDVSGYSGGFVCPIHVSNWQSHITSGFGSRIDPVTGSPSEFHAGIDIAMPTGTPIYAAKSGKVSAVLHDSGGYGNHVVIDHGGGVQSLYGHMSRTAATVGETVNANTVIGYVGSTGKSTGPHCHFEIDANGKAVNPMIYLQ